MSLLGQGDKDGCMDALCMRGREKKEERRFFLAVSAGGQDIAASWHGSHGAVFVTINVCEISPVFCSCAGLFTGFQFAESSCLTMRRSSRSKE
ncbi:MAG: hypothetical protein Q4A11_06325 [Brachymonas sp.]|nr:hypothetical protein [Brachymonas sp.]